MKMPSVDKMGIDEIKIKEKEKHLTYLGLCKVPA